MAASVDLRTTAGAVPWPRDVLEVAGPDAATWLQGQLSQQVEAMEPGASAPSFLLQPTGRLDAWLRVHRVDDHTFRLDVDAGWGAAVQARLERFKLRVDATLTARPSHVVALRGPGTGDLRPGDLGGEGDVEVLPAGWPGVEGVDLVGPLAAVDAAVDALGLPVVPAGALEALRIEAGVPAMGAELTERTIPGEAGRWVVEASADFTKGCYTGQELVARVDSRGGNVPRPVRGLVAEAPVAAGDPVHDGDREVGTVTSAARSPARGPVALAVVARAVELDATVTVGEGTRARLVELPMR